MIFAELPLADCAGAILVHTQRCGGQVFKKGRRLSAADLAVLQAAGIARVTVARLEPNDIAEDLAAHELAQALRAPNLRADPAFTGRANLYAERDGLFVPEVAAVGRINRVSEDITVATLPAFSPVTRGQMVATVKIIPFAVQRADLDRCLAAAAETPALRLAGFRPRRVALVQTVLPGMKPGLFDKAAGVMNERLAALGGGPVAESRAPHETAALTAALRTALPDADLLLVMGASAIADRHDVIPAAIEGAGGTIRRFGMPVDPGNLLVLGEVAGKPVIGLPGCARSPKINGFDWVLQRIMADVTVGREDIAAMGVGGLLGEIPSRPQPRDHKIEEPAASRPEIAAVVLAAGQSSRMGRNKLLLELDGKPILCHAVDHALAAGLKDLIVVCGHQAAKVRAALGERKVRVVEAREHRLGMSASLKAGIRALSAKTDAALVLLGDMPQVTPALIRRLIAAYNPLEGRSIVLPTVDGKRGNPVLFDRRYFAEILALEGDVGARHLIGAHDDQVAEVAAEDAGIFTDVDTPEAYDRLRGQVPKVLT